MKKIYIFLLSAFFLFCGLKMPGAFGQCSVNAGSDVAICKGQSTQLTATATGSGSLSYLWSPITGLNSNIIYNPIATPTVTTTYTVTVIQSGCSASDTVSVEIAPDPVISFSSDILSGCVPITVNFTDLNGLSFSISKIQ